jgi:hypothetical protein
MEVFIYNVSYTANKIDVQEAIANILHGPEYLDPLSEPWNFDIRLFPNRKRKSGHSGCGALTVPNRELGSQLLRDYGTVSTGTFRSVSVGSRFLRFTTSRGNARPDIVDAIQRLPYEDPNMLRERERRAAELRQNSISVRTIQFGWVCRDSVFSVEWEKTSYIDMCGIYFNNDPRELRIKSFAPSETRVIAVRFSQIAWSATSVSVPNQPVVLLFLNSPPSFETEVTPERAAYLVAAQGSDFRGTVYDIEPRKRLTAFDDDHARVVPYTSCAIRLVCSTQADVMQFRQLSRVAELYEPQDYDYPVEYRELFSSQNLAMLQSWLRFLDFEVAFQVESMVRSLALDVQEMLSLREDIDLLVEEKGTEYTSALLRHFAGQARVLFWDYNESQESMETILQCFQRSLEEFEVQAPSPTLRNGDAVFDCLHTIQTPSTIRLEGPFPEQSNRVVRSYPGHHLNFLRVSFVDETRLQYRFDREVDGRDFIQSRVGSALSNGISVGGRIFKFLAYSMSALKEHAVWFVKPFYDDDGRRVDAKTIIESLGEFRDLSFDPQLIYCPARYGARISQAFTATDSSVSVEVEEIFEIDDMEVDKLNADGTPDGKWCFTDGVGTISKDLARAIWRELKLKSRRGKHKTYPCALQVRFQGSKGMLSVDHRLSGRAICLRPSMIKFAAPNTLEIEIARAFDKAGKYHLNRPLITVLEGLGVPYGTFKYYQDLAVEEAQESTESLGKAARLLETYGLGTSYRLSSVMLSLQKLGIDDLFDDFCHKSLEFAVHHVLRELKQHSRIHIPGGCTLVGVADVHGYLKEGEIFACYKTQDTGSTIYLEGPTLISRSPTIHPGDVQVVNAIGRPPPGSCFEKDRLLYTVVFSTQGSRPLPSFLGGGDLDGDIYNLIPLNDLPEFTPETTHPPSLYDAAPKKVLDRPSTMDDVADFFVDYISSDVLGIVATNWLIIADQSKEGIFDADCLKLGDLHSDAVDYPKTGQPVALNEIPRLKYRAKPDWNAPETVTSDSAKYYQSEKAIGRLFRSIELPAFRSVRQVERRQRKNFQRGQEPTLEEVLADLDLNHEDEDDFIRIAVEERVSGFIELRPIDEDTMNFALQLFNRYASELRTICTTHTLTFSRSAMLTEEEAMIGTIVAKCSQSRKRKDLMAKLREQTNLLVTGIREELMGDEGCELEDGLMRSWLAWELSNIDAFGAHSFGWIALGGIFEAIKDIEERDEGSMRH